MVEAKGYSPVFFEESFGEYIVGIETERNWFVVLGWCLMDLDADKNLTVRQIASLDLFHFAEPLVSL